MTHLFAPNGFQSSSGSPLSRRRLLAHAAAAAAVAAAPRVLVQADDVIRLGQSVALTGPLGDIGSAMRTAAPRSAST